MVGIGLGMATAYTVGAVLSAALLRRRLGGLDGAHVLRTYVRLLLAGAAASLAGWGVSLGSHALLAGRPASVLALVVGGAAVTVVFAGLCRRLHVREVDEVAGPLLRRLPARLRPQGGGGPGR